MSKSGSEEKSSIKPLNFVEYEMSGSFGFAEAFIPHQKRGYSEENFAPLEEALKEEIVIRPGS